MLDYYAIIYRNVTVILLPTASMYVFIERKPEPFNQWMAAGEKIKKKLLTYKEVKKRQGMKKI